ncbi:MAG: GNAT family N-acetyltransferase [Aeromicrobium sp.]
MPARPPIVLRDADREDAAALINLWRECAETSRHEGVDVLASAAMWHEPGVAEAAAALELNLASPDKRIIVALVDGDIVGAVVCDIGTTSPINLTRVLVVTELQVLPKYRRKSVASTLLSAAANYGEDFNCEIVATMTPAHDREPNRFLTKLGFSQVSVVRVAQASRLRSKLSTKATNSRDTGKLIAVRRTLRRRQLESRKMRPRP